MKKTIITTMLAPIAMTGWAQKPNNFTISGDLSVMTNKFGIPAKADTVYILNDYVGKGQYVLVDFWASWCGPCRREIPNIIAAYNKYKEKGLQVLGVAAWDKPEDTKKAIQEEQIPYPQILNSQKIATDVYGVDGIPEIILFAPDGTIFARGLRGTQIENKLAEVLGEK